MMRLVGRDVFFGMFSTPQIVIINVGFNIVIIIVSSYCLVDIYCCLSDFNDDRSVV